jgi:hypothetical protein
MRECVRSLLEEGDSLDQQGDTNCLVICDCMQFEELATFVRCCLLTLGCLGAVTLGTIQLCSFGYLRPSDHCSMLAVKDGVYIVTGKRLPMHS